MLAQLRAAVAARPRRRASCAALLVHQRLEAVLVNAEAVLGDELEREVEREAVRVVQQESVGGGDPLAPSSAARADQLVEQRAALLQRAPEALLLGGEPLVHRLALLGSSRYSAPISSVTSSA